MELSQIFQETDFQHVSPRVYDVIRNIELIHFHRERDGKMQTFFFHFIKDGKYHVFRHRFLYHNSGVDHWFSFQKSWFSPKPFSLYKSEYEQLSNALMKAVNKWNSYQPKRNIN